MFISQTTDFHFANYRFSFRKLQILISQTTGSHFANYRFSFRKLKILISQTTDFHFANYRFPFRFVPFRFVPFHFVPFRFANYSKPKTFLISTYYFAFFSLSHFIHDLYLCGCSLIRSTELDLVISWNFSQ